MNELEYRPLYVEEDEWPEPSCDECGVLCEEADGWCGVCGNCAEHCQQWTECVREAEATK